MGSQEPPLKKTIIGQVSLGSFIKVSVRTPPLIVLGIRFGGVIPPETISLRQGPCGDVFLALAASMTMMPSRYLKEITLAAKPDEFVRFQFESKLQRMKCSEHLKLLLQASRQAGLVGGHTGLIQGPILISYRAL